MRQTVSTTEKSTWAKRLDRIGASPSLNNQEASGGREETGYIIVPKFGIPYDNKKNITILGHTVFQSNLGDYDSNCGFQISWCTCIRCTRPNLNTTGFINSEHK